MGRSKKMKTYSDYIKAYSGLLSSVNKKDNAYRAMLRKRARVMFGQTFKDKDFPKKKGWVRHAR